MSLGERGMNGKVRPLPSGQKLGLTGTRGELRLRHRGNIRSNTFILLNSFLAKTLKTQKQTGNKFCPHPKKAFS